jgi:hypothetical protein
MYPYIPTMICTNYQRERARWGILVPLDTTRLDSIPCSLALPCSTILPCSALLCPALLWLAFLAWMQNETKRSETERMSSALTVSASRRIARVVSGSGEKRERGERCMYDLVLVPVLMSVSCVRSVQ